MDESVIDFLNTPYTCPSREVGGGWWRLVKGWRKGVEWWWRVVEGVGRMVGVVLEGWRRVVVEG